MGRPKGDRWWDKRHAVTTRAIKGGVDDAMRMGLGLAMISLLTKSVTARRKR